MCRMTSVRAVDLAGSDLTEFDWWAELGIPIGKVTLTPGATGYIYPNDGGLTEDNNTIEIYGKFRPISS